jgi:hypothetical protein
VHRLQRQRFQNEQVQRSLRKFDPFFSHEMIYPYGFDTTRVHFYDVEVQGETTGLVYTAMWTGFVNTGILSGTDLSRRRESIPNRRTTSNSAPHRQPTQHEHLCVRSTVDTALEIWHPLTAKICDETRICGAQPLLAI